MTKDEMFLFVEEKNPFIEEYKVISNGWFTLFTLSTTDSSVLEYLNNNNAPVVYSSILDGIILVKYS